MPVVFVYHWLTTGLYWFVQHKGLPYCDIPCYCALFGPHLYHQGVGGFEFISTIPPVTTMTDPMAESTTTVWVKKTGPFTFENNFCIYCPIVIILSLSQTGTICRQTCDCVYHFTCSLLLYAITYTLLHRNLNKSAVHALISLSQCWKFWWYLLLSSSMLLHDIIMMSYWRHSVFNLLQCLLI